MGKNPVEKASVDACCEVITDLRAMQNNKDPETETVNAHYDSNMRFVRSWRYHRFSFTLIGVSAVFRAENDSRLSTLLNITVS
jgi:hypothetical protein